MAVEHTQLQPPCGELTTGEKEDGEDNVAVAIGIGKEAGVHVGVGSALLAANQDQEGTEREGERRGPSMKDSKWRYRESAHPGTTSAELR